MIIAEAVQKSVPVVWRPHLGAQTRLLTCPYNEILYGGAKGGGKSDGILGHWLGHCGRNPKHARGIIFRQSFPELEQLIARSKELFPALGAVYKAGPKTWFFPGGATLKFRFLSTAEEAKKYQGHEYTWIAFDEVGDVNDPGIVNELRGALRSSKAVTERVLLLCGNPMGAGHKWLKKRFIGDERNPIAPETPVYERMTIKGAGIIPDKEIAWSRVFIPALLEDNPTLREQDPAYELRLQQMCVGKPWLYRALRFGDWTVKRMIPGAHWTEELIERHRIEKAPTLRQVVVGVDPSVKGYDPEKTSEELQADGVDLGDFCGIVAVGQGVEEQPCCYTLEDASLLADPRVWSRKAVECAIRVGASIIVAESNNGGELVRIEIEKRLEEMHVRGITVVLVPARVGKYIRATPVAADMMSDLCYDVGEFPALTEERTTYVPSVKKVSPNRYDAYVWAHIFLTQGVDSQGILNFYKAEAGKLPDEIQERIAKRRAQYDAAMQKGRTQWSNERKSG